MLQIESISKHGLEWAAFPLTAPLPIDAIAEICDQDIVLGNEWLYQPGDWPYALDH